MEFQLCKLWSTVIFNDLNFKILVYDFRSDLPDPEQKP
jgi:hypothetical protein